MRPRVRGEVHSLHASGTALVANLIRQESLLLEAIQNQRLVAALERWPWAAVVAETEPCPDGRWARDRARDADDAFGEVTRPIATGRTAEVRSIIRRAGPDEACGVDLMPKLVMGDLHRESSVCQVR